MTFYEVGQEVVRGRYYDKLVKGIADATYKFKQACKVETTGAWTNYFFRGSTDVLAGATTTGITGNLGKGIPRNANFPQASISWERVSSVIEKYGLEENIPWEDLISDEINVEERTLFKIAEGVTKAIDDEIWSTLTEDRTPVNIQSIDIAAGYEWNATSAAIIDNLLQAKQKMAEYNYPTEDLMCYVSPKGYRDIMNYLASKGAQFPSLGNDVATNGRQGRVAGIMLVESNSVTASYALVVVPKRCATWKELVALSVDTKEDRFKSKTYRAVEMGVTQLTDPKAVVLIKNTDAA